MSVFLGARGTGLRYGYTDTAAGQVHYRRAGDGRPLLLLHWTPGSGAQYEALLPALARRGYAAYAPDLVGFGNSTGTANNWLIEDFAQNMHEFTRGLGWDRFAVLGGHVSSEIAAQMAVSEPSRISHLILDGSPTWDRNFRTDLIARILPTPPTPVEDGTHLVKWWSHILWELRMWNPNFKLDSAGGAQATRILLNDLQSRFQVAAARALIEFEMSECLSRVRTPTLAITAKTDPLNAEHAKVLALVPGVRGYEYPGDHPIHDPKRAEEYVEVVDRFLSARDAS